MKIRHAAFALPVALLFNSWVTLVGAQEPSKQPPLEMPKSLIQLDAPAKAVAAEDKEKPKAPPKKAKPVAVVADASDKPAKDMAKEPVKEAPKDSPAVAEIGSYKVKAGDTVERIIQKFYASSPLRVEVLREALVQNNPKSFVKANPKSLIAGSTLSLPDPTELVKKLMPGLTVVEPPAPAVAPSSIAQANVVTPVNVPPVGGAAAHQSGHNPGMPDPKRNWVRYP